MNPSFIARSRCPCCESIRGVEIYRLSYASMPLRDYLLSFYGAQGNPDLRSVED
jgi:hypothetical protein